MKRAASVNKRISVIAGLSVAGLFSIGAQAHDFNDTATVISSTPIYERVSIPRQQCWTEQVAGYEERRVNRVAYDGNYDDRYQDRRYDDRREYNRGSSGIGAGTVLGAVIGGAIGHQFGNSSGGRDRGTAVGAILGGIVGNNVENNGRNDSYYRDNNYRRASAYSQQREYMDVERVPVTRDVQRCQTVADTRDEVRGYDVRYRYHGREYTARLPYDPGSTLQVDVNVRPVSRGESRYDTRYGSRTPAPIYSRTY